MENLYSFPKATQRHGQSLAVLAVAYFTQASAAYAAVGGLQAIASQWHLGAARAALLVTAFGATFALAAPLLQMLVGHWVRRTQILAGLLVLAVGALAFALAQNFPALFTARVLMGLGSALISPVVLALGSSLVPAERQGTAIATVLMGLSVASVVSVPGSAWLAQQMGPRALFGGVALLALATALLLAIFIRDRTPGQKVQARHLASLLGRPATLSALMVILLFAAGNFVTYTMITAILRQALHQEKGVSMALAVFGLAGLVGNAFVRRMAQRWSAETLMRGSMTALLAVFAGLWLLPPTPALLLTGMVAWAFILDVVWPSQQRRIVELEPQLRGLALALTSSFLFLGIAAGSALGGSAFEARGLSLVLEISLGLIAFALLALNASIWALSREDAMAQAQMARVNDDNVEAA
jgi:predicted MFS family arabinose efflux permease